MRCPFEARFTSLSPLLSDLVDFDGGVSLSSLLDEVEELGVDAERVNASSPATAFISKTLHLPCILCFLLLTPRVPLCVFLSTAIVPK